MLMAAYMSQNEVVGIHFAWALFRLADEPWQSKLWGILIWGYVPKYVAWFVMEGIGRISPYHRPFQGSWWPPCGWSSWSQPVKDWRLKILTFESKALTRQQRRASNDQKFRDFHTMSRFVKDSIANKTPLNIRTFMSLCHLSLPSDNIFEVLCGMWVGSWWSTFLGCNYCSKETWRCLWEAKHPIKGLQNHEVNFGFTVLLYLWWSLSRS